MNWLFREMGWRLLPGSLAAVVVAGLAQFGVWQPLEQSVYRALFQLRGPIPWDSRLVVVAIDDQSLQALGQFPWSRRYYSTLLQELSTADPAVVVFNLVFPEQSPDDSQLAQAIAQQGSVVLAQGWDAINAPLPPTPLLRSNAMAIGHVSQNKDTDGLTRNVSLYTQGFPALGLAAIAGYKLTQGDVPLLDLDQDLWINWPGPVAQLQKYSFIDVLRGQVPASAFQNKIVLVGVTAAGLDPLPTPFDRNPPATGTYLQAAVISNLLQGRALHQPNPQWLWGLFLVGGPGLSYWLSRWRTGEQFAGWLIACIGWGAFSLLMFHADHLLPVALPWVLFSTTAAAGALQERLRENALLKREVEQLWKAHVHDLVDRSHPNTLALADSWHPPSVPSASVPASMEPVLQLALLAKQFGRSQSTQAAIARSLSLGLVAADLDGLVWFCNPVATKLLQVQIGDSLQSCLIPEWLSLAEWQRDLEQLAEQGQVPTHEFQRDQGWLALTLEPLLYRATSSELEKPLYQLDGLLLVLEDISQRKQVEANLSQQMDELQKMNLLKDDFLSTVSHELRSPMANMKMAIYMLKIARSPEQKDHYLKILQDECEREINLINDLLDLQRLEASAKPFNPELIDLQTWLPQIVEPFQERAKNRQQSIQVQFLDELPPIVSDQNSLERVLAELLNNACKYTPPEGSIDAIARLNSPFIELSVSNSGSEIPEAELTNIFQKFYRVPQNDRWKQGGTGLGLALVKKLAEYLGGDIRVTSAAGQTTFTLSLPLKAPTIEITAEVN